MAECDAGHALSTFTRRPYHARNSSRRTSLVGRDTDIVLIAGRLLSPAHRLLTLVGPGGVGKSRLAAAVAERLSPEFTGTVGHVDLTEVTVPSPADAAVARALGVPCEPGRPARDELTGFLAGIDAMLVLDGCEHLAEAAALLVSELLATCPGLRVLATSRTPLRVKGEYLVPVAPLRTPGAAERLRPRDLERVPSVSLFVRRVRAVNPGFVLTAANAETVGEICALLDGLPAAIEIAADRARTLGMSRLLTRLRDGQDIVRCGHRDGPDRHRSLRAITEWSYRLLSPDQRTLLDLLAVCDGDFDFGTIKAVWPDSADVADQVLETLVDGNLVLTCEQPDGELRFGLPATVRAFCAERLRESARLPAARRRHAEYVRAQVTTPPRERTDQPARLRRLAAELGNVRGALDFFLGEGDHLAAAETALAVSELWLVRGPIEEDLRRLETIAFSGPYGDGRAELPGLIASVAVVAGRLTVALGDPARAVEVCERARDLQCDELGEALATAELGRALTLAGAHDRARALLGSAVARLRAMDENLAATPAVLALAAAHQADHDLERAETLLTGVVSTGLTYGDVHGVALAEARLALIAAERGRTSSADGHHRRSLRHLLDLEDHLGLAAGLEAYALFLWAATGQGPRAVRLLAAADTQRRTTPAATCLSTSDAGRAAVDEACRRLRIDLGTAGFETAWDDGGRLGGRAAAVEALSAPTVTENDPADPAPAPPPAAPAPAPAPFPAATDVPRHGLTPRQFEVATLVARGMTNRQISRELDISQWTVVNHIREVMRKLNVPSRVHVAQWVARHN